MDTIVRPHAPIKILLETRPALDLHAGIPQQTRLLFRGLSLLNDAFSVAGLLQSSTHALGKGLPLDDRALRLHSLPRHRQIDRLGRVIITLEQKFLSSHLSVLPVALRRMIGRPEELTRFEPHHFRDFIWRRLFARTLPPADFDLVMRATFRIARAPWGALNMCSFISRGLGHMLFPRLNTAEFDVMIAETPYPARVSKSTRMVVHYHDAIPLLMPHTISNRRSHQAFHYHALRRNVTNGAWFACVSEATRKDLISIFPHVEARAVTIHNMVSHEYFDEPSCALAVPEIIRARVNVRLTGPRRRPTMFADATQDTPPEYLLSVSTVEPRKNHLTLLSAWERLRASSFPHLKLILVGSLGWHHLRIVQKFRPWIERGEIAMLEDVPSAELRVLYKHSRATICPSFAEGFDLPGIEAMRSGGVVIASDIPVHREIYKDAAEYFNPYSVDHLLSVTRTLIDPTNSSHRSGLATKGAVVARRYTSDEILPQWKSFITALVTERPRSTDIQLSRPVECPIDGCEPPAPQVDICS